MSVDRFFPRAMLLLRVVLGGRSEQVRGPDGVYRATVTGGKEVETPVVPEEVTWTVQPHSRAATCEATISTATLAFDAPDVHAISVTLLAGRADSNTNDIFNDRNFRQRKNIRFLGDVDEPEVKLGNRPTVTLKARDLSARLRDHPIVEEALPSYSDSVTDAITRIVEATPGGEALEVVSDAPEKTLASLVGKNARRGHVPIKHDASAWSVIETIAGMAGLLVSVELDQVWIRRPGQAFGDPGERDSDDVALTFLWGSEDANTSDVHFHKKFLRNRRGIIVYGFDPETDRVLEAKWPPDGNLPVRVRPSASHPGRDAVHLGNSALNTKAAKAPPKHPRKRAAPKTPERDPIWIRDVHTVDGLLDKAKAIWAEQAAQEVDGELSTPLFSDEVLARHNGDRVLIKIRPDIEAELRRRAEAQDREGAVRFLQQRLLVSEEAARAMVAIERRERFDRYLINTGSHTWRRKGDPSSRFTFINLIKV